MTNAAIALDPVDIRQIDDLQQDLYLSFHLHGEDYGISISYITEIIGIQKITAIPDMPDFIKGIINLRGRVIPIMDIRLCFGLPFHGYDERTCIIVVEVNEQTTGLVVDRVKEVIEIQVEQIESVLDCGDKDSYVRGLGKLDDEVKILLNVESLVSMVKEDNKKVDHSGSE